MKVAVTVIVSAGVLLASIARADFEPNDSFATRAILDPGVMSVSDSLRPSVAGEGPDTTLGAFDASNSVIEVDDDSSPLGDGTASGLFDVSVNSDGSVRLKVSGYADFDFDGNDDVFGTPHPEAGEYDLHVHVYDASHQQVDYMILSDVLVAGAADSFNLTGYASNGYYDAYVDNTPSSVEDPMDFMTFTALPAGYLFVAEITSADFDTLLGWFDDGGGLIERDGEGQFLAEIMGGVPDSGMLNLAVTGYPDVWFEGFHAGEGNYALELSVMPPLPGDANFDGWVDGADYTLWADHYNQSGGWGQGDFNGDGSIDGADYTLWADHLGQSIGGQSIPEPAGIALFGIVAAAGLRRRTSRAVRHE